MKTFLTTLLLSLSLTIASWAGGIAGRVTDGKDRPKANVTMKVKVGGQSISVTSDKYGNFVVEVPSSSYGHQAKVYVSGTYVTSCTIPQGGNYATVNIKLK